MGRAWGVAAYLMVAAWAVLAFWLDARAGWVAIRSRTASELVLDDPLLGTVSLAANSVALLWLAIGVLDRPTRTLLVLAGACVGVAIVAPTDPGRLETITGWVHGVAAATVLIAVVLALWRQAWLRRHRHDVWVAAIATGFLMHLGLLMATRQWTTNDWTQTLGLAERASILANMFGVARLAWLVSRRGS